MDEAEKIIQKIVEKTGLPREEIERRIEETIQMFSGLLTRAGAAYAVAKDLGVEIDVERELAERVKIKELQPGMEHVDVVGKVVRIFPPRRFERNGRPGRYCSVIIADETGQIRLTLWHRDVDLVEKGKLKIGDIVEIINGYVREFKGMPSLSLGFDGRILINPDIPEAIKLKEISTQKKVSELEPNMSGITITLTVFRIFPPGEAKRRDGETVKYRAFIGGDESGTARVVLWGKMAEIELEEGDIVQISGAYTREGLSGVSLHVPETASFQVIGKGTIPQPERKRVHISELEEGDKYVEVRGTVVQVYDINPLTAFCNVCGGRAEWKDGEWVCTQCGSKDVRLSPILSFQLDDGTGTIRVVAFGRAAQRIYGSLERDKMIDIAKEKLLGRDVVVSGYVRRNKLTGRLELVGKLVSEPNIDQEISLLLSTIKELEEQGKEGSTAI